VCPVRIPLPRLMRHWREEQFGRGLAPPAARWGLATWAWLARHPLYYRVVARLAATGLRLLARDGRVRRAPLAGGWTATRDLPAPQGGTFMSQWRARGRR